MGMKEVSLKINLDAQNVVTSAQNISDAFTKIVDKMKEAQEAGDIDLASKYANQAQTLQQLYNGMANGNSGGGGKNIATPQGFMSGVNSASSSIRGAIGNFSQGDAFGGGLSLLSGGAGLAATFGGPIGLGVAAALAPVIAGGYIIKDLASKYEEHINDAMEVNARLNETEPMLITDNANGPRENDTMVRERNTKNIRNSLKLSMKAAEAYGYQAEAGVEQVKKLAEYGYTKDKVFDVSRNIFGWAKTTGLESSALADFKGMMYRYDKGYNKKNNNYLEQAYYASKQMGLEKGQFGEALRGLEAVFRDGISKGFSKSIGEMGSTLAFLTRNSDKSPFWTGEEGVKRYRNLNEVVSQTSSLNSPDKIIRYNAVASLPENEKKAILESHGIKYTNTYQDNMMILDLGFNSKVFKREMDLAHNLIGDKSEEIEYIKNTYGKNYIEAQQLYDINKNSSGKDENRSKYLTTEETDIIKGQIDNQEKQTIKYDSDEMDMQRVKEQNTNSMIVYGMGASQITKTVNSFIFPKGENDFRLRAIDDNRSIKEKTDDYNNIDAYTTFSDLPEMADYRKISNLIRQQENEIDVTGGFRKADPELIKRLQELEKSMEKLATSMNLEILFDNKYTQGVKY